MGHFCLVLEEGGSIWFEVGGEIYDVEEREKGGFIHFSSAL